MKLRVGQSREGSDTHFRLTAPESHGVSRRTVSGLRRRLSR